MGWVDADFAKTLATYGTGAAAGTLLKSIMSPEKSFKKWIVQTTTSMIVGILAGAAVAEWMQLGYWAGLAACAAAALISEKIVALVQARGEDLKDGNISVGLKKDE